MTASGPFALGPAMMGASSTKRAAPRSNIAPVVPGSAPGGSLGAGLTNTTAPGVGVKRETSNLEIPKMEQDTMDEEGEVYSDPDEGVEIVDMENVKRMDWMAPESLRKNRPRVKAKREWPDEKDKALMENQARGSNLASVSDVDAEEPRKAKVNLANALNLSDSEEEEELEDIIHDFAFQLDADSETVSCTLINLPS
jgi:DNA-directed RNA polymerase III subunit RPC4